MNIITLNLPRTFTEKALTELFSAHGEVASCTIVMDKATNTSKGFGFIDMPNNAQAQAAIKALHGTKVEKNKIRVKQAEEKQ